MHSEQPLLSVTSFGGFSIAVSDPAATDVPRAVLSDGKGHSKKLWSLVEYLIFSGKESVTFEELIELLWPEDGPDGPLASLRLLVHRARIELDSLGMYSGSELIIRQDKAYSWNRQIPVYLDTERFDELYNRSRRGSAGERLSLLLEAAGTYQGRFLPKSAQNQWVMVLDTYYHSKFLAICEEAVGILEQFGRTWDIIELCKKAVALDPYAETLHVAFIKALTDAGSYNLAMEHYKRVTSMFMDEFGITPSEELKAVYSTLVKSTNALEADIGVIRESLADTGDNGAFFLECEMFKHVYQLKSRESMRSGQAVQLALISVSPSAGKNPGHRSRLTCMTRLSEVIQSSLRQGDLYTRYSVTQYLALLQSTSYENGQMVLDRIQRGFKAAYPKSGFLLQCSMLPLLPKSPAKDTTLTSQAHEEMS